MKGFDRLIIFVVILFAGLFAAANVKYTEMERSTAGKEYNVEISRICRQIELGYEPDLSECRYVTKVRHREDGDKLLNTDSDYAVREVNGELYRFDYDTVQMKNNKKSRKLMNAAMCAAAVLVLGVLIYIRFRLLRPFFKLVDAPAELAKGNLTVPLQENRNRYFGKFVWSINMLREVLEERRQKELELQGDKQRLLLSVSHDIKTPLAAIKLYSAAISKGLYKDPARQEEIIQKINEKADEAERFVSELAKNSDDNFLRLDVNNTELYISEVIDRVDAHYRKQLTLNGVEFKVEPYEDCIVKGDPERLGEVLQNIIGNAVKYGDGGHITLSFDDEDGCRLITVTNSGCTLEESELIYIFDSFRRGANSVGKAGSGLGLFICRSLMTSMNGDIFAEIHGDEMCVTIVLQKP